jgi:hypothetical protein
MDRPRRHCSALPPGLTARPAELAFWLAILRAHRAALDAAITALAALQEAAPPPARSA